MYGVRWLKVICSYADLTTSRATLLDSQFGQTRHQTYDPLIKTPILLPLGHRLITNPVLTAYSSGFFISCVWVFLCRTNNTVDKCSVKVKFFSPLRRHIWNRRLSVTFTHNTVLHTTTNPDSHSLKVRPVDCWSSLFGRRTQTSLTTSHLPTGKGLSAVI